MTRVLISTRGRTTIVSSTAMPCGRRTRVYTKCANGLLMLRLQVCADCRAHRSARCLPGDHLLTDARRVWLTTVAQGLRAFMLYELLYSSIAS